ncbi:aromatic ring-hydroxylating dioxygenase subunit alpha [Actinocorallia sp. A-T 12471]|uniref:aromatic ring-hydroxylating dioxygenase subunit alpha n=1 Tax=Actinocorallia sp. A-T 12471 TaxID=3089813 RepID=UPI0029CBD813|nr:aromatic ring-hydroxylating dioxygenase subunit alpha [Actinocorallia sp. A-T 12471]MDX6743851.1 aromatic ring-hydroxylating dioxygenase subunit alpha [Actinocorallia sp. A-T 12471]
MTIASLPRDCTFDPADWAILAAHWYPVALTRDIGDLPTAVTLLDERLVVYRANGSVVVAPDLCPHRGLPLSMGTGDGTAIACGYHGLRFGEGGRCVGIPAHPTARIPERMHLATYPAVERYGLVWTCLRPTGDEPDIPRMAHWDEPGFQQINCPHIDIAAFAGRQLEGFLDVAHFGFVHLESFGDPGNTEVPEYTPVRHEKGFSVDYWSTVSNYARGGPKAPEGFRWLRHFDVHLPFTATLVVHFPGGGRLNIMNAASPVSARMTRMFAPIARDFDTDQPVQGVYDFNRTVFEEDARIVEAQRPENLPLDPRIEVNIPADRSSVAYRRGLRDLGLSHFFTA